MCSGKLLHHLQGRHTETTVPHVSHKDVSGFGFAAPPLPEQKRIAAILDKADAIRRKRQEAIRLTEELLRSAFLEMFGDPVTNPKGWEVSTIADVCESYGGAVQTGPFGSQLHASDYSVTGTPVVMPQDLVDGGISEERVARVSEHHVTRLERHQLRLGDVVFSRRGDVARFAVVEAEQVGWLCGTGCLRVRFAAAPLKSAFVRGELADGSKRAWLEGEATGTTMLNLNTSILGRLPVRVPPMHLQEAYSKVVDLARSARTAAAAHRDDLRSLQETLTQRAFSGRL
jgi:type I restriction enzyme S subunit